MRDAGEWEKCFQTGAVKAGRRAGRYAERLEMIKKIEEKNMK